MLNLEGPPVGRSHPGTGDSNPPRRLHWPRPVGLSGLYATKLREAMVAPLRYGGHDPSPGPAPICRFSPKQENSWH